MMRLLLLDFGPEATPEWIAQRLTPLLRAVELARLACTCVGLWRALRPELALRKRRHEARRHRQSVRALFFGKRAPFPPLAALWSADDLNTHVSTSFRISARDGRVILKERIRMLASGETETIFTVIRVPAYSPPGRFTQIFKEYDGTTIVTENDAFATLAQLAGFLRRWTVLGQCYWPNEHASAYHQEKETETNGRLQ